MILLNKKIVLEASPGIERTLISLNKLCNVTPCFAYSLIKMCNVKRFVFPHKSTHVDNLTIHDESKIFGPRPNSLENTPCFAGGNRQNCKMERNKRMINLNQKVTFKPKEGTDPLPYKLSILKGYRIAAFRNEADANLFASILESKVSEESAAKA